MLFVVNGTLMRGLELNHNLLEVGATFLRDVSTASVYRMWSINDQYPGMVRDLHRGVAIHIELWEIDDCHLIQIIQNEPPGLTIGWV